jgi:hypothetical protein
MESISGIAILLAGGCAAYIAWKIFLAALEGLSRAGNEITDSWPRFFEKVWRSVITGVVAGVIIGVFTGGDLAISSASAVGVALVKIGYDIFTS